MFVYMARQKAPRDPDGSFIHAEGATLHKRGEVGPEDDQIRFKQRMEDQGYEVRFSAVDLGDEIAPSGKTIHAKVIRRPGRDVEVVKGGAA